MNVTARTIKLRDCSDTIIRFIVPLAMAANDLSMCQEQMKLLKEVDKGQYHFRAAISHLRELAQIVKNSRNNVEIVKFLKNLDEGTYRSWEFLVKKLSPYDETSVSKSVLKPIRDINFHYPDIEGKIYEDLPKVFRALDFKKISYNDEDVSIQSQKYIFADDVKGFFINEKLSKGIVNTLSFVTVELFVFVDGALAYLKESLEPFE